MRKYLPKSFEMEELAAWYMRYISPLALIAGFFADNLILLRRVDVWTSHALLFSYLVLAALCIVVLNLITTGRIRAAWVIKITPLIPVVAQFAFGGLFSGYLSLYSRSASFPLSWIFVLLVAALLIGNERFVRQYMKFSFQMSMFFAVLFSFLIFFLPVIFRSLGPWMFVASGLVSLAIITLFLRFIGYLMPEFSSFSIFSFSPTRYRPCRLRSKRRASITALSAHRTVSFTSAQNRSRGIGSMCRTRWSSTTRMAASRTHTAPSLHRRVFPPSFFTSGSDTTHRPANGLPGQLCVIPSSEAATEANADTRLSKIFRKVSGGSTSSPSMGNSSEEFLLRWLMSMCPSHKRT